VVVLAGDAVASATLTALVLPYSMPGAAGSPEWSQVASLVVALAVLVGYGWSWYRTAGDGAMLPPGPVRSSLLRTRRRVARTVVVYATCLAVLLPVPAHLTWVWLGTGVLTAMWSAVNVVTLARLVLSRR
jgi:hypothetical protein